MIFSMVSKTEVALRVRLVASFQSCCAEVLLYLID
ncbi:MAG: hypothetical protein MR380_04955 [Lachnospiraceae bacterium]|nr:hypothetical protein [Lachnospiraceae bacterium]